MRPKIICHMTSTVDGRLLTKRWTKPAVGVSEEMLSGYYDQIHKRFDADGWLVGRTTMEEFVEGTARTFDIPQVDLRKPFAGNRNGRKAAVVVDLHGKLHYGRDDAVGVGDHIIAILGEQVSDRYLAELQHDGVSYLFTKQKGDDAASQSEAMHSAMTTLGETFGIKTLLLEGGGITNGTFLKAGLIDEISLLVYPGIDGLTGMPTIFEYSGRLDELPAASQSLRHLTTETLEGGTVWIHYRVERTE